ncbi:MAG: zinc-ribbon domain-containing protein [Acidobacteriaceae bacterium]|nr:zinc-ribbon domain-containing protein [Acidobacteriaceae bacterium]
MTCPNCGLQNAGNARFCANCGTPLNAGVPVDAGGRVNPPGGSLSPAKAIGLGCLIIVVLFLLFGLSCARSCFFPRHHRIYIRRVYYPRAGSFSLDLKKICRPRATSHNERTSPSV